MSSRSGRRRRRTTNRWISAVAGVACALVLALTYALASANPQADGIRVEGSLARDDGKLRRSRSDGSILSPQRKPDDARRAPSVPDRQGGHGVTDDPRRVKPQGITGSRGGVSRAARAASPGLAPRRRGTVSAAGFAASLAGLGGGGGVASGGFLPGASPSSQDRSVFSGLVSADALTRPGVPPQGDDLFGNGAITSRSPDFDPCASGGLVVRPCFRPYFDPCPPGGLVVSPCFNGEPFFVDEGEAVAALNPLSLPSYGGGQPRGTLRTQPAPEDPGPESSGEGGDDEGGAKEDSADPDVMAVPAPPSAFLLLFGLVLVGRRR